MKQLAVISGKGGTGKTSIAASLARLAKPVALADCDVDAADLHLLLHHEQTDRGVFSSGFMASVDGDLCTRCGVCVEACAYDAIDEQILIDPIACEGCGVCEFVCPHGAIRLQPVECGQWFVSNTVAGPMSHARLHPGKENSGRLVSLVRKKAVELAQQRKLELIIIDGPPGVGCPVIASIGGVDAVLIVTEPSLAGMHDCERVAELAAHFKIPAALTINKFDISDEISSKIEGLGESLGIEVVGKIPYTLDVTKAQLAGKTIVEYGGGRMREEIERMWKRLEDVLFSSKGGEDI